MRQILIMETNVEHTRSTDDPLVRINREVPLWSLLTGLALVAAQAAALYYNQQSQTELLKGQAETIKELSRTVTDLSSRIQKVNLDNVRYEFQIQDLDRRVQAIERSPKPPIR
jgi:hypothetical protein